MGYGLITRLVFCELRIGCLGDKLDSFAFWINVRILLLFKLLSAFAVFYYLDFCGEVGCSSLTVAAISGTCKISEASDLAIAFF